MSIAVTAVCYDACLDLSTQLVAPLLFVTTSMATCLLMPLAVLNFATGVLITTILSFLCWPWLLHVLVGPRIKMLVAIVHGLLLLLFSPISLYLGAKAVHLSSQLLSFKLLTSWCLTGIYLPCFLASSTAMVSICLGQEEKVKRE